jgi:hypothetical protein
MNRIIGFILAMSTLLSAEQISFDNNISQNMTNVDQEQIGKKCHMQWGRYNPLYTKCVKPVDNNLTLSNIYTYIRSL